MNEKNKSLRLQLIGLRYRCESLFSSSPTANAITALLTMIDFTALYLNWTLVCKNQAWYMAILLALGFAIALDVPMAIAGSVCKAFEQKLVKRREMLLVLALSLAAFLSVFTCMFAFRVETRDQAFEDAASSGIKITEGNNQQEPAPEVDAEQNDKVKQIAAISINILTYATSVISFFVAYKMSDPLAEKKKAAERALARCETYIDDLQASLVGVSPEAVLRQSLQEDQALFEAFAAEIEAEAHGLRQLFAMILMEERHDPDAVTVISAHSKTALASYEQGREHRVCSDEN